MRGWACCGLQCFGWRVEVVGDEDGLWGHGVQREWKKMVLKDEDENGKPDFEMAGVRDFRGSAQGTACEAGGARQ